jgi:hypothetical protein
LVVVDAFFIVNCLSGRDEVNDFDIRLAAVDEDEEEQDQPPGHPDDLITLLSIALDEVVFRHNVVRIVEDFRRGLG